MGKKGKGRPMKLGIQKTKIYGTDYGGTLKKAESGAKIPKQRKKLNTRVVP